MTKNAIVILALTTFFVTVNYFVVVAAGEENHTLVFQGATITANLKEAPLKIVFEKVQKETGIWFKFAESELDESVSIQFENLSVKEGLKRILRTMNYSFLFDQDNNQIGAFVFGKTNRQRNAAYPSDLNERMLKAAMAGNTTAVVELLAKGADVNVKNKVGSSALMMASGYPNVLKKLKEAGAEE